jgi:hypothetical protein
MALLSPGWFHSTWFPSGWMIDDWWPEYGIGVIAVGKLFVTFTAKAPGVTFTAKAPGVTFTAKAPGVTFTGE